MTSLKSRYKLPRLHYNPETTSTLN